MRACPKCQGRMTEGFIVDSGDYGTASVSTWQGGEPKKSFWTGLKQDKKAQKLSLSQKDQLKCRRPLVVLSQLTLK